MNIGRSEYTRLVQKEVRLKKAEKLLEECVASIQAFLVSEEAEYGIGRTIEEIMGDQMNDCDISLVKDVQDFLEEK